MSIHRLWLLDVWTQVDVALLPFFERFQIALLAFQGYDLSHLQDGAVARWLVSGVNVCRIFVCRTALVMRCRCGTAEALASSAHPSCWNKSTERFTSVTVRGAAYRQAEP